MSNQKFFLHIGTHKTATTTIQNAIRRSKERLQNEDNIKWIEFRDYPRITELMKLEGPDESLESDLMSYLDEKTRGHSGSFLASSEGLSGSPSKFYRNNSAVANTLRNVLSTYSVEIILMVRRQDEFIQSYYTQLSHSRINDTSIEQYYQGEDLRCLNWMNFIEPYEKGFGQDHIHAFPYDRALLEDQTPLELINKVVKSRVLSEVESLKNENVGYSNSAKRIAQDLNPMLGNDANRQVRLGLQSVANKGVLKEYNLLNQKNKQDLVDSFEPSNRAFFEKYISSEVGISGFSQPSFIKQDELSEVENYQRLVVYLANNLTEQIKLRKLTKKSLRNRVSGKLKSVLKNGFKG